jgi:hypothetical protein
MKSPILSFAIITERCSAQLQYLYGREPRQLVYRKEASFLYPHRAKPILRLWLSRKASLDRAAALCLSSVNGLRFPTYDRTEVENQGQGTH